MGPRASMQTSGAAQLAKNLEQFGTKVSRKIVGGAIRSAIIVIARAQRAAAPKTVTPGGTLDIKSAIGYRVMKTGRTKTSGKAGGGVGSKSAKISKRGSGRRGGVGITGANIHWYIFGTMPRYTGRRTSKSRAGRISSRPTGNKRVFRGRMPVHSFIRAASEAAAGPANFVLRSQIAKGIGREWAKRQKASGSRY